MSDCQRAESPGDAQTYLQMYEVHRTWKLILIYLYDDVTLQKCGEQVRFLLDLEAFVSISALCFMLLKIIYNN